uniref:2-amino-4-hydroxy-6-hydroxymethyldihydropteridine pyrophosphokinase n=1 Tax=Candidatus Kentrum sp. MB TaxID=2138164 RepID=A0A450XLC8_9GAMM|nr:MAG: 2-amino-4-hydroxy-6-hydroxymethyldihydropteridinediphosphokinase [Candidatus Kentron sp. MB]
MGVPSATVRAGLLALDELPETVLLSTSLLYRSPPFGPIPQPDFINAVAAIQTLLAPLALLSELQSIEHRYGRVRGDVRWGPRTLDLDLLLYGDRQITGEILTIPHPGLHQRAFVLYPLYEIAPQLTVPGRGPVARLLEAVREQPIQIADCPPPSSGPGL